MLSRVIGVLFGSCIVTGVQAMQVPSVTTEPHAVTNVYHGVSVIDDYQWLEDAAVRAVRQWVTNQNARTRAYFSELPFREGIAQELMQLRSEESARVFGLTERKGKLFALRFKPPAQQPVLIRLSSLDPPALWRPI